MTCKIEFYPKLPDFKNNQVDYSVLDNHNKLIFLNSEFCEKIYDTDKYATMSKDSFYIASQKYNNIEKGLGERFYLSDICQFDGFFKSSWTRLELFPKNKYKSSRFQGIFKS